MVVEGSGQFPDESLTVDNANRGSVRGEPSEGFDTAAGAARRGGLNQRILGGSPSSAGPVGLSVRGLSRSRCVFR